MRNGFWHQSQQAGASLACWATCLAPLCSFFSWTEFKFPLWLSFPFRLLGLITILDTSEYWGQCNLFIHLGFFFPTSLSLVAMVRNEAEKTEEKHLHLLPTL